MKYVTTKDFWSGYVLESGKRFYAHGGILGLGPGSDDLLSEGYDGGVDEEQLSLEDRREIAAFMMQRWLAWGNREL